MGAPGRVQSDTITNFDAAIDHQFADSVTAAKCQLDEEEKLL
jgi:hypothetical protein